jgi:hypothetical protein
VYMKGPGDDRDVVLTGNVTFDLLSRTRAVTPFLVVGGASSGTATASAEKRFHPPRDPSQVAVASASRSVSASTSLRSFASAGSPTTVSAWLWAGDSEIGGIEISSSEGLVTPQLDG